MTKIFKKSLISTHIWGKKHFLTVIWFCHAQLNMGFQQLTKVRKKNDPIQENVWPDRQTLFHRTLPDTVGSPTKGQHRLNLFTTPKNYFEFRLIKLKCRKYHDNMKLKSTFRIETQ